MKEYLSSHIDGLSGSRNFRPRGWPSEEESTTAPTARIGHGNLAYRAVSNFSDGYCPLLPQTSEPLPLQESSETMLNESSFANSCLLDSAVEELLLVTFDPDRTLIR